MAVGDQKWCSLSRSFVHPNVEGRERCKWKKCLVGDTVGGDAGWDIRVGLTDADSHVFTEAHVCVCVHTCVCVCNVK